jgi:hypothetical protein
MGTMASSVQHFIWSRLGHCRACMRKAWLAAVIALIFAVIIFSIGWRELWLPSAFIVLGLTGLWVAHLVAFASKVAISSDKHSVALTGASVSNVDTISRRNLIPFFVRSLFLGVLISAAPRSAVAQSITLLGCGREPCTSDCTRPGYQGGQFIGCIGCHSCGNTCRDSLGTAFPNGC